MPVPFLTDARSLFMIIALWRGVSSVSAKARRLGRPAGGETRLENVQADPITLISGSLLGAPDHAPASAGLDPEMRRARLFRSLLDLIRARAHAALG
jgi:hypothetical protein